MLAKIKKYLPKAIKSVLSLILQRSVFQWQKKHLSFRMQRRHKELIAEIKGKQKIRVVFLAIHKSVWKVDTLFQKMLSDPLFDPVILICPYTAYGEERMLNDMNDSLVFFNKKNYPVLSSYDKNINRWIKLNELNPDLLFFTNPNDLTRDEYYRGAFMNYLSCYVPYFSDMATDYDLNSAYNQSFHNLVWKHFIDSNFSKSRALSVLANKGKNIEVTGSPFLEVFFDKASSKSNIWKTQKRIKKKIIYAPHQSIFEDQVINLSTFLEVGEVVKSISEKYQDTVQWSFKPHPQLKTNLYNHPDWGKSRTDIYYSYWEASSYTQLDDGDYVDLFKESDAILHDCGSFILDYLCTRKVCAYIEINSENQLRSINSFGLDALNCYERIRSSEDLESFVKKVAENQLTINSHYIDFYEKNFTAFYGEKKPSELILKLIKDEFI